MPLVIVKRNADKFHSEEMKRLVKNLPAIVAKALSSNDPDGVLTASDIEVWDRTKGYYDSNVKDLEVVILANLYPERQKNLDTSQEQISRAVRAIVSEGTTGFVWVLLAPGSFGKF